MSIRIALVGPDGTGKTTIARALVANSPWPAQYIYMGVNHDASNVMLPTTWLVLKCKRLLGMHTPMGGPPPLATARNAERRSLVWGVKSLIRMANLIAEEWYRFLYCWLAQRCGKTVIMDRHYFLDYYSHDVQPRCGHRNLASRIHGWMLRTFYPRPDLVLFLDADADVLFRRKPEGTVEQLQRRREEYLQARPLFPQSVVLDVDRPLEEVIRHASEAIASYRTRRLSASAELAVPAQTNHRRLSAGIRAKQSVVPRNPPVPAVIVGQDCYTGLQTSRILAARGIRVIGIAENVRHFGCSSRSCREIVSSSTRTIQLIDTLEQLGRNLGTQAVLIPCVDMSVLLISQYRKRLEKYFHIALPDDQCVEMLLDKTGFYEFAERSGFPVPKTFTVSCREQACIAAEQLTFPCIIKPAVKTDLWEKTIKTKVFKVTCAEQLLDTVMQCLKASPQLCVQEWIEGSDADLFTCNCYFSKDARPLVTFLSKKIRQWPPDVGVASLGQECRNDEVKDACLRLFQSVGFKGLGYLEMKRDRRNGKYYFIEANIGRPTGRSATAEAAGVELLATMYCDLLDLPLPEAREQRYGGVKWIYWRKDLRAALYHWRRGELSCFDWWRSVRGRKVSAVFSLRDPLPCIMDLGGLASKPPKRAHHIATKTTTELLRSGIGHS